MKDWILQRVKGDRYIWWIVGMLSIFSLLAVYSSTGTLAFKYQQGNTEYYLIKHVLLAGFGLGVMYLSHLVDYRYYSRVSQILLYISVPLLLATLFLGPSINDAHRWLTLPLINITFQTSDLAKLALIMYTARMLSKKQEVIKDFKSAFLPIIIPIMLVCGLILPADLSTAVVLFGTTLLLMFIGRVNMKHIMSMMGIGVAALGLFILIALALPEGTSTRLGTWQSRIESFMDSDTESYQVQQAKIAIAKGGLVRLAPGQSWQRNFLPHPYSDFIFAIIIEEYGLMGGAFIVLLYLLLLWRCIRIVARSPKAFGALLAVGLGLSLTIQAMINMAVTVNLLPVTGLPLPLVSMGGTSLIFTSLAIGIILSVSRQIEETETESDNFEVANA